MILRIDVVLTGRVASFGRNGEISAIARVLSHEPQRLSEANLVPSVGLALG